MMFLRKCIGCGLEAYTVEDLKFFVKTKPQPYGRRNHCKTCMNKYRRINRIWFRRRQELIEGFGSPVLCYFCGKEISILNGRKSDSLHIHSLDGDHENWNPLNKVAVHSRCHNKHHHPSFIGDKNPNWKGDEVSKKGKYWRVYRARKRLRASASSFRDLV